MHRYLTLFKKIVTRAWEGLVTPLGTLLGAGAVAAACAVVVHQREMIVLAAIVSIVAVGLIWPWLTVRPLSATLEFERDRSREGQSVSARLKIRNRGPLQTGGVMLAGLSAHEPILIGPIRPFGKTEIRLSCVPTRRGGFPVGTVHLTSGLPFGLWHPRKEVSVERCILIWPAAVDVGLPPEFTGRNAEAKQSTATYLASEDTPSGVRPYRRGDLVKLIHHAQTARHDRLIVRELCPPAKASVTIILDVRKTSYSDDTEVFERAVRLTASLYEKCRASGIAVELATNESRIDKATSRSDREVLDCLARIQTGETASAFEQLSLKTRRHRNRLNLIVTSTGGTHSLDAIALDQSTQLILADGDLEPPRVHSRSPKIHKVTESAFAKV